MAASASFQRIYTAIRDDIAVINGGEGIDLSDQKSLIRRWDDVQPELVADCYDYLERYTSAKNEDTESSSVTDLKIHQTTLDGLWRGGKVTVRRTDEGKYQIFQDLHRGLVSSTQRTYVYQLSTADGNPDLNGLRFYDSGTNYNSENVYYGENDAYARWNSTTYGWIFTGILDVGNEDVVDYFVYQDYPENITVTGDGPDVVLPFTQLNSTTERPEYQNGAEFVKSFSSSTWVWQNGVAGESTTNSVYLPPKSGWAGIAISYTDPSANLYWGKGAFSGTLTISSISVTELDFSEWRILTGGYYHATHEMPVLRLRNVSPTAVHDICQFLNVDTFTDIVCFNDTLSGPWKRIKVEPNIQEDGSYEIILFLTDEENTDLYFFYPSTTRINKGHLFKWDTTEDLIKEKLSSSFFDSTGAQFDERTISGPNGEPILFTTRSDDASEAGLLSTLYWYNSGDAFGDGSIIYHETTGVYAIWDDNFGANLTGDWTLTLISSIDDATGGVYYVGSAGGSAFAYTNMAGVNGSTGTVAVSEYVVPADMVRYPLDEEVQGRTVQYRRTSRDEQDRLFDFEVEITWRLGQSEEDMASSGNYIVTRQPSVYIGYSSLPTDGDLDPQTDPDGQWRRDYALTGPSGSGIPTINADGTYDYAVVKTVTMCSDKLWHLFGVTGREPDPSKVRVNYSPVQIRQLLSGDYAYERDSKGNLVGIDWNVDWDTDGLGSYPRSTPPANWVSHGYQARYGDWQPYWKKGYMVGEGSLSYEDGSGGQCRGEFQEGLIIHLGDVVYASGAFRILSGATAWASVSSAPINYNQTPPTGNHAEGEIRQSGNKIYTCKGTGAYAYRTVTDASGSPQIFYATNSTHPPESELGKMFWDEGVVCQETVSATETLGADFQLFTAFVKSKIAIDGNGVFPFERADLYVPLKQPLQRIVEWNNDWDAGTFPGATPPSNWVSDGYEEKYGEWKASWTKGFTTGAGSIYNNLAGGKTCRGVFYSQLLLNVGDVVSTNANEFNPGFRVVTGASSAWAGAVLAPVLSTASAPTGSYSDGAVVESGGEVYTCRDGAGSASFAYGAFSDSSGVNYILYATNSTHPPESGLGQIFWEKGAKDTSATSPTKLTFADFDETSVKAVIALSGSGLAPFENAVTLGVLNEDGTNMASSQSRHAFYNNIAANPQWVETWRCNIRFIQSATFYTYFAVNPHWLAAEKRRIPQTFTNTATIESGILDLIDGVLGIPISSNSSNYKVTYDFVEVDGLWAAKAVVILMTQYEPDLDEMAKMVETLEEPAVSKRIGDLLMIAYDFTGALDYPWGNAKFKDLT